MRKSYFSALFVLLSTFWFADAQSQSWSKSGGRYQSPFGMLSITGGVGVAYYMGDLQDGVNMKHLGLGPAVSIGALYRVTDHFSARGEIRFYQVSADQKYSKNSTNNLSFKTSNPDINLGVQADLFSFNSHAKVNPYLFAGFGLTHLNPKARLDGTWHKLAPLTTEGVKYGRLPLVITGALGVSVQAFEKLSFGIELANNFVQSDYLDDVSTVFPNPDLLPSDLARRLSDRSGEIGLPPKEPGWSRGSAKNKDSYLFLQLRATYLIGNRAQAIERKKMRCPKY